MPRLLLVFPAELEEGREFFSEAWPEVGAISDPNAVLFADFGVGRAGLRELFGPGVWLKAVKAARKGYSPGRAIGSPWIMPGFFLVANAQIKWKWKFRNIGDNPDLTVVKRLLEPTV